MHIALADSYGRSLIDPEKGDALHRIVADAICRGERINLDFAGVDVILSAFFNPALGELYKEFTSEMIANLVEISNETDSHRTILNYVIENAKLHATGHKYELASEEAARKMLED